MEQNRHDPNAKLQSSEVIIPKGRAARFFENVWYHYKWHILIIAFFVVVLGVCIGQCLGNEQPDVVITYAGGYTLDATEVHSLNQIFTGLLEKENNNQTVAALAHYSIYTQEELYNMYHDAESGDNGAASLAYNSARQTNVTNASQFSNFLLTGESAILLVSEWVYQNKISTDRMMTLDSVLGYTPESAADHYAIKLSETELYKHYEALQVLPEDTLVVLAQPTFAGATSNEEIYAIYKALFRAIVEYQP